MRRLLFSWVSAETLEAIGLWLIIVGLIGEAALIFEWPLFIWLSPTWEKPLSFILTLAIAAGVWVESIGATKISDEISARLAAATERAARAEEELAKFRTARRKIFSAHKAAFVAKMSRHSGTKFEMGRDAGGETMHFLWDLWHALKDADWIYLEFAPPVPTMVSSQGRITGIGMVGATNVEIHLHPSVRETLEPIAVDLVGALNEIGIDATVEDWNVHSMNVNAIHIAIGPKG